MEFYAISLNNRMERIHDLEINTVGTIQSEQQRENRVKKTKTQTKTMNVGSLRGLWESNERANICVIGIPGGKEKRRGAEKAFK